MLHKLVGELRPSILDTSLTSNANSGQCQRDLRGLWWRVQGGSAHTPLAKHALQEGMATKVVP